MAMLLYTRLELPQAQVAVDQALHVAYISGIDEKMMRGLCNAGNPLLIIHLSFVPSPLDWQGLID